MVLRYVVLTPTDGVEEEMGLQGPKEGDGTGQRGRVPGM